MALSNLLLREVRRFTEAARPEAASDRALLGRFADVRDDRAFAELVARHGPMVLGVCRRVLRHATDAEDAFQATFLVLVRKAGAVRDPERLGPWLYGVAWRTANKLRVSRRAIQQLPADVPDHRPSSDWPVEVDAAIARLPDKYRVPIVLCHLQGLSPTEVADRLGCPTATVATRLFRAREHLRRRLAALGVAVPSVLVVGSTLHVPSALASSVREMAAGRSIPLAAARLADGVFRSLTMAKFRWLAASTVVIFVTSVGLFGFRADGQEPGGATRPPVAVNPVAPRSPPAEGPTYKSKNFHVTAPSARIARLVADTAERARKDLANIWFEKEQADWETPVRINALVSKMGSSSATTFHFDKASFTAEMRVEGELDRLLADLVPHEVTHCLLAGAFGGPVPRWADEGIALMSESTEELDRHAVSFRRSIETNTQMPIQTVLEAREYPKDVAGFYQYSLALARFLVERKDRRTLIEFVAYGMDSKRWEEAAKKHYDFASLAELDDALRKHVPKSAPTKIGEGVPAFAMASLSKDGQFISIEQVWSSVSAVHQYEYKTEVSSGQAYQVPVLVTRHVDSNQSFAVTMPRANVRGTTVDGKPILEADLNAALKDKPIPVVLIRGSKGLNPAFAKLLQPQTIVLILPPADQPKLPGVTTNPIGAR